ncbi:MAG: aldehyde dehydrogenase family protein [Bacteroidia bacterium]|nr:aldehyde dehydrogenase family protein [Bacteroidia bacterium]
MCRLESHEKFEALKFISETLQKNKNDLGKILSIESAKPLMYAIAEIERAAQTFLIAAEESKRLPGGYMSLDWTENGKNKEGIIRYFPAGIVAGISPFNFPMNLAVHKIAPAIAAGCPIILKPASATPLSTLALARIIAKAGLPKGAVSILPMDRKTGNLLVTDDRIQLLSFTGSPEIGWELKKQSGKKKVVLELGGNAGVIVSQTVEAEKIIDMCLNGAFSYSGQICIHAQRFFVHADKYEQFISLMMTAAKKLKEGDPLKADTKISVMIDEENAKRVEEWVNEAIKQGAKLICGGKRKGNFYLPTILTGTKAGMKVYDEEVFGPVICIEKFRTFEEAVTKINDTRFGLQCGVFTDSVKELNYAFKHIETGGIIHNDVPTLRFDQMPYGGIKDSGLGREGVKYAIMDMMEAKVLVK